jgi:uncharacterized membrane protein YjfL (UPF0719 family)
MILQSLAGLPAFLVYFCTAIVAVVAYLFVYTRVTPHNELQLIRDNDPAAAIALGLSLLGFVLPVVSAIAHSANVVDCLIWQMALLLVGTFAIGGAYALMPGENYGQRPGMAAGLQSSANCPASGSSSGGGHGSAGFASRSSFWGGDTSSSRAPSGIPPDSGSGGVTRGGFGGLAHAFTSHFSGGG